MEITNESYFVRKQILEKDLTDLRHLTPEQVQTIVNLLRENQEQRNELVSLDKSRSLKLLKEPLLKIELQDESSVPKVFYKGEEIESKTHISFDWSTKKGHDLTGGLDMRIEHFDNEIKSLRIIGRRRGECM